MSKDFKPNTQKNNKVVFDNFLGLCKGCGLCIEYCPQHCIAFHKSNRGVYGQPAVDCTVDKCTFCKICERICPDGAILLKRPKNYKPEKN